jgi:hypothetical protein
MGHRKGQPPPQRTMFTPGKQPSRRRGKGFATTESLRYAMRYDKFDKPLAYREVKNICATLLSCSMDQIKEFSQNTNLPIILTTICKAMLQDYAKGKIKTIEWLLDRAFGKPKKSIERIGKGKVIFSKTSNGGLLMVSEFEVIS